MAWTLPSLREAVRRGGSREGRRPARKGALARAAAWVVPRASPADAVYGVITVGALLAAEGALHETYEETIGSVAIAMSLYGFAHAYAELLGLRLAARERPTRRAYASAFARGISVLEGASLPLVALLVAWAVDAPLGSAVTAAIWTAIASLVALELAAGVRAQAGLGELAVDAAVGVAIGLGILALKALVA